MKTPICEQLGIEFPIFAFSHCRDVAAAVSRAGGFGVLGALAFTPDELEVELNWIDEHVDGKPYGVDIVMPMNYVGKGGGDEAKVSNLEALIPKEHWEFAEKILAEYDVPPLPEDLQRAPVKAAGLGVDEEGPGHRQRDDAEDREPDHHLDQGESALSAPHGCTFRKSRVSIALFGPVTVSTSSCRPLSPYAAENWGAGAT